MSLNPALSPAVTYALKGNIAFRGTSAQATALQTAAASRLVDATKDPVTGLGITAVTIAAGSVKVANP